MSGRTAVIAGVGATDFGVASGKSDMALAVEAITAALDDAACERSEIGGLVTFVVDPGDPVGVATALGLDELNYYGILPYGGAAGCATVQEAAAVVEAGIADVVVVYRAQNLRSGVRYGRPSPYNTSPADNLYLPYGLITPAQRAALLTMRYFHDHGWSNEDLAPVSVAQRTYAATNPAARFFGQPISIQDHQASAWIIEPALRLLDCCLESDGGVALVVTTADRAKRAGRPFARVVAAARGMVGGTGGILKNFYRTPIYGLPETRVVAQQLFATSGLGSDDIDLAIFYDHFSPFILLQLEAFGFCETGKAPAFVAAGETAIAGRLPVNTHGGHLSEAYIHGMNGIAEAVRQLTGRAVNQVRAPRHALVTSGPGLATSGLILGAP